MSAFITGQKMYNILRKNKSLKMFLIKKELQQRVLRPFLFDIYIMRGEKIMKFKLRYIQIPNRIVPLC